MSTPRSSIWASDARPTRRLVLRSGRDPSAPGPSGGTSGQPSSLSDRGGDAAGRLPDRSLVRAGGYGATRHIRDGDRDAGRIGGPGRDRDQQPDADGRPRWLSDCRRSYLLPGYPVVGL